MSLTHSKLKIRFAPMMFRSLSLFLVAATFCLSAAARPAVPLIIEPEKEGQVVNGADVHMVTAPFSSAEGRQHLCTDWEIVFGDEVVWAARCARNAERIHVHLADGVFEGARAGQRELAGGAPYKLRVRHRDDGGDPETEWSEWTERTFLTSDPLPSQPLRIRGLLESSESEWTIDPPDGATIRLEATDGESMLELNTDGQDVRQLPNRSAVRVVVTAGDEEWLLSESELTFEDENGRRRTIYLPAMALEPKQSMRFWVSANGGTHHASDEEHAPNFTSVARGVPVPWTVRQRGFVVERVATGFQLPVNIAFIPNPGSGADDPLFYVAELYGTVQVVTRSGEVREFATNLLDIPPTGHFPGNGESGLAGITVDAESGDVFVTAVYWPDRTFYSLDPRVMRLRASDDGLRAESVETVKGFPGETQSPSHQISQITIGPDRKLYVHVGDGAVNETAQDMNTVRGKILRMNLDGSAPPDNPFYNEADGLTATDYIYALGYRNPFGGAWRAWDQSLYVLENGPFLDRLSKLVAGRNYLWDGVNESMKNYAICTWDSPAAPVQMAFVERETFGGSGFPRSKMGSAFVTESGPTYASGVQAVGKRISEVALAGETLARGPLPLVEYNGTGKATVSGIAAGPDGLYFTDLYKDFDYKTAIDRGANVFRIRWTGYVLFDVRPVSADGRTIHFVDRSDIDGLTTWTWDFGDGTFGSESSPRHEYAEAGTYVVRLHVTGASGELSRTKKIRVGGDRSALAAEYFADGVNAITRAEGTLDFHWDDKSPDPLLPADGFSARWSGTLQPRFSETYRFTVESTDRVRVRVGGVTVINRWEDSTAPATGEIELEAGRDYDLFVEYFDDEGAASLRLFWESASQLRLVVPQSFSLPRRRAVH